MNVQWPHPGREVNGHRMTLQIQPWQSYRERYTGDEHTVVGNVCVMADVYSPQLDNARDVIVYLPPSYSEGERRYPVVYMHDAQNLFDRATSFIGEEWQVDETMESLSADGLEAVVVGLPHAGERRIAEYSPPSNGNRQARGDRYVAFVCETVKPMIDRDFRTQTGRDSTTVLGSSMGGLISLYAFFARPDVFGRAGAMSPSLWAGRGAIYDHVGDAPFVPGRIYLDNGTREAGAQHMADLLKEKGYREGRDLLVVVEKGGRHTESAWARRLPGALRFLVQGSNGMMRA